MNSTKLKKQLVMHEGLKLKSYLCSAGKLTIGVGRNIEDVGLTESEAMMLLDNDILACVKDLRGMFHSFDQMPENIKMVLADMRFQLGPKGFRGFRRMLRAVKVGDWPEMVRQMKDSAWYGQTPNRANDLIRMVQEVE